MNQTIFMTLEKIECAACGILFGISSDFKERRRSDHSGFYCPAGHSNVYKQENEEERLRKIIQIERAAADQIKATLSDTRKSLNAQKAQTTRIKNRIANGVCPCCNRSFKNILSHMNTKHPEYKKQ